VLLQAEVLELKAPVEAPAKVWLSKRAWTRARVRSRPYLFSRHPAPRRRAAAGSVFGRVRAMLDETGQPVDKPGHPYRSRFRVCPMCPSRRRSGRPWRRAQGARNRLFRQGKFRDVKLAKQQAAKLENMFEQMGEGGVKTWPC